MPENMKYMMRLLAIARVLAKYDALFFAKEISALSSIVTFVESTVWKDARGSRGERLAKAFAELGPTFIKLGQFLAVRPDIVGDDVAEGLAKLQDKLPPFDGDIAIRIIENEFGRKIDEIFSDFSKEPVAAASIAQVHFAITKEKKKVAVKVLRPGIENAFAKDIELFNWLAKKINKKLPNVKRLRLPEVVATFAEMVKIEMDLRFEAAAASELKENMKNDEGIFIPEVDWQRTTRRVLTMERIKGIRIDDKKALAKAGHDVKKITKRLAEMFFVQVLRDGFFHADMHPGNLFVDEKGNIAAVDFGIMGRLDKKTRIFMAEMILGFLQRDYKKVADVHFAAGYVPLTQNRELFAQACRSIGEPIFGKPQNEISLALLLGQLFKITEDFEMETQPQLLLLQKTMMLAEGMGRKLNPEVNFWDLIKPLAEKWGDENMNKITLVKEAFMEDLKNFRNIINNLSQYSDNLKKIITPDGIKIHPETIEKICNKNNSQNNMWKLLALSAIVSAITAIILVKFLI